jgi:hypothetical protein
MSSTSPTWTALLVRLLHHSLHNASANSPIATVTPTSINAFIDTCAEGGQQAKCCLIPILGQALLCSDVNPTAEVPAAASPAA